MRFNTRLLSLALATYFCTISSHAQTVFVDSFEGGGKKSNPPPVANDDDATTKEGVALDIDILANDTSSNSTLDKSNVIVITSPSNGAVKINKNGIATYIPNPGFSGTDSFTYKVCNTDKISQCANAKVTIKVSPKLVKKTWGSKEITGRVNDNWLKNFNNLSPIVVDSTGDGNQAIQDAISKCPDDDYCVLEVSQLKLSNTVYLSRSKTKIIGADDNQITYPGVYAFFRVGSGVSDFVFEGLNIDGQSIIRPDSSGMTGIVFEGENIQNTAVINNRIHHLHAPNVGASAISYLGQGKTKDSAIRNNLIKGNTVNNMKNGYNESISLSGNISQWEILSNTVDTVDNIAIAAIGGEGVSPPETNASRILPSEVDRARFGFIEKNTVNNLDASANPAYPTKDGEAWSAAIYIDGANHVQIANNQVSKADWGYEIGAENCVESNNIVFKNNTAKDSKLGDLLIGGYAKGGYLDNTDIACNPKSTNDPEEGHGNVRNITVQNNDLVSKTTKYGNTYLQFRIYKSLIENVPEVNTDGIIHTKDGNSIRNP